MGQPTWRVVVSGFSVPSQSGVPWTKIIDYVSVGNLLKIEVTDGNTWTPDGFSQPCSADGDISSGVLNTVTGGPLLAGIPAGALIGRIGGSTADMALDSTITSRIFFFAVGRCCILQVPASTCGALFLGVNDRLGSMGKLKGQLTVSVYQAF